MRWLTSLAFVGLASLVLSETPSLAVRRSLIRQPLIKLAVQPAIASEPVALTAPAISPAAIPYMGGPQYWGGYNYNPWMSQPNFWGGYRPRKYAAWGGPYWRPRLVAPVKPSKEAVETNTVTETETTAEIAVKPEVDASLDVDAGVDAAVVDNVANMDINTNANANANIDVAAEANVNTEVETNSA